MDACRKTCRADTRLHFGFDIDDPAVRGNLDAADWPDALVTTGPRDTLTGWTNKLAIRHLADAPAMASLGDDHLPVTVVWHDPLLAALPETGGCAEPAHGRPPDAPQGGVRSPA